MVAQHVDVALTQLHPVLEQAMGLRLVPQPVNA